MHDVIIQDQPRTEETGESRSSHLAESSRLREGSHLEKSDQEKDERRKDDDGDDENKSRNKDDENDDDDEAYPEYLIESPAKVRPSPSGCHPSPSAISKNGYSPQSPLSDSKKSASNLNVAFFCPD